MIACFFLRIINFNSRKPQCELLCLNTDISCSIIERLFYFTLNFCTTASGAKSFLWMRVIKICFKNNFHKADGIDELDISANLKYVNYFFLHVTCFGNDFPTIGKNWLLKLTFQKLAKTFSLSSGVEQMS